MKKITIRVSDEAYEWLESHKKKSVSGLAGRLIDKLSTGGMKIGSVRNWILNWLKSEG